MDWGHGGLPGTELPFCYLQTLFLQAELACMALDVSTLGDSWLVLEGAMFTLRCPEQGMGLWLTVQQLGGCHAHLPLHSAWLLRGGAIRGLSLEGEAAPAWPSWASPGLCSQARKLPAHRCFLPAVYI